jgi:hypothetical protein
MLALPPSSPDVPDEVVPDEPEDEVPVDASDPPLVDPPIVKVPLLVDCPLAHAAATITATSAVAGRGTPCKPTCERLCPCIDRTLRRVPRSGRIAHIDIAGRAPPSRFGFGWTGATLCDTRLLSPLSAYGHAANVAHVAHGKATGWAWRKRLTSA